MLWASSEIHLQNISTSSISRVHTLRMVYEVEPRRSKSVGEPRCLFKLPVAKVWVIEFLENHPPRFSGRPSAQQTHTRPRAVLHAACEAASRGSYACAQRIHLRPTLRCNTAQFAAAHALFCFVRFYPIAPCLSLEKGAGALT